jgi:hypothetical protein
MADLNLDIKIPSLKTNEYVGDYVYVHKNIETEDDPAWVDPGDGTTVPQIAKYTDAEWMHEHVRRYVAGQVERGKSAKNRDSYVAPKVDDVTSVDYIDRKE